MEALLSQESSKNILAKPTLLSIDDNPANQKLIQKSLQKDYSVLLAMSALEGLQLLPESKPDLILLDVNMPDMDGYEACKLIRAEPHTQEIPILFISCLNQSQDKIKGYRAGGDDFISKPVDIEELKAKVAVNLNSRKKTQQLKESAKFASDTAMTAMKSSGELGTVLNFALSSFSALDKKMLFEAITQSLSEFDLQCCVKFWEDNSYYASTGFPSDYEYEMLDRIVDSNFIQQGKVFIRVGEHISLLIRDFPIEDEERCGRLRDHMAHIVQAADARLKLLIEIEQKQKRLRSLPEKIERVKQDFDEMDRAFQRFEDRSRLALTDFSSELEFESQKQDLDKEQRVRMQDLVERCQATLEELMDLGADIETEFNRLQSNFISSLQ